ncbi:hypothetical protein MPLSOD_200002 [Mesorhizobium sp. SOD10]|nr:hypothetical protein MPLSOD_200002 [Mesorhizobium sp. SOD10]
MLISSPLGKVLDLCQLAVCVAVLAGCVGRARRRGRREIDYEGMLELGCREKSPDFRFVRGTATFLVAHIVFELSTVSQAPIEILGSWPDRRPFPS